MAALLLAGAARAEQVGSTNEGKSEAASTAGRAVILVAQQAGGEAAQRPGAMAPEPMKEGAFDISGKVSKVSKGAITLTREKATAATLHVDSRTRIEVDGTQARLSELKPGQDVKASFNLKGDKPMAIEIRAQTKPEKQP